MDGKSLVLACPHQIVYERLTTECETVETRAKAYFGQHITVVLQPPKLKKLSQKKLQEMALKEKPVQDLIKNFQARILYVEPLDFTEENDPEE